MKNLIPVFVVALGIVGCSDGSSSSKETNPAPAADKLTKKSEKPKTKKIEAKPTTPIIAPTEAPVDGTVVVEPPVDGTVVVEPPVDGTVVVNPPDAMAPPLADGIRAVQGTFFDAKFHALGVSRSIFIYEDRFVSRVRGLARGSMIVIANQVDEGSVVVDENGKVNLVLEKSTCDDAPESIKAGARHPRFSDLKIENGSLAFAFTPVWIERKGSMEKVEWIKDLPRKSYQVERDGCFYLDSKGRLATFIQQEKALPASL